MSKRAILLLLEDMREAVEKIQRYTENMDQEAVETDDKTTYAVVRNLEIIGEAANRLPKDFRESQPEVEWIKIIGLRHSVVHKYFGVDLGLIWQIIQMDLPIFSKALEHIHSTIKS